MIGANPETIIETKEQIAYTLTCTNEFLTIKTHIVAYKTYEAPIPTLFIKINTNVYLDEVNRQPNAATTIKKLAKPRQTLIFNTDGFIIAMPANKHPMHSERLLVMALLNRLVFWS